MRWSTTTRRIPGLARSIRETLLRKEADGTPVALGNYDSLTTPYTIAACNATGAGASMGSGYTSATSYHDFFSAPITPGGPLR